MLPVADSDSATVDSLGWRIYLSQSVCQSKPLAGLRFQIVMVSASLTSLARIWDAIDQPTICLEYKSITTARYNQPSWVAILGNVTHINLIGLLHGKLSIQLIRHNGQVMFGVCGYLKFPLGFTG
jgi:hypothetical protein